MKFSRTVPTAAAWLAGLTGVLSAPVSNCTAPILRQWPPEAAAALGAMIKRNAHQGQYAIFDMDNTSWRFDLEESLLPYLEQLGVLTRDTLDPSLRLLPFKDAPGYEETLYSYYLRLCDVDSALCYPWAAQVWAGLSLRELKGHVDDLMALNGTIATRYWDGDALVDGSVSPPRVFGAMAELYRTLQAHGIAVYVVSASSEELVRFVASDPRYGYHVPPENVLGVTTYLRNTTSGALTTSRAQVAAGEYNYERNLDLVYGPYLGTPATWFAGKWAAVLTYIDEWKRPILAGGDTPGSDTYMIFHGVDVAKGGVHLWINRSDAKFAELQTMIAEAAKGQAANGREVTVDKNWVVVKPEEIL